MRKLRAMLAVLCMGITEVFATPGLAAILRLDIPSQDLRSALATLSQHANVQLLYDAELAEGRRSPALQGEFTIESALSALLAGAGLIFEQAASGTIVIGRASARRAIGTVEVVGIASTRTGANGSSDVLATENSDRYAPRGATVGSPFPQAVKNTPRSLSVLGLPQLRDQGIVELADALRQLPGASVRGMPVDEAEVRVRAFELTEYQVDGGVVRSDVESRFRGDLDIYDRIELLRGADGLGNGFASPAGLLNLVRKRPLDRRQIVVEAQGGSWDDYRGMLDVSSPLGWDGRLRGRAVGSVTDRGFFYDTADLQRRSLYAVVEAALAPTTVLAVGAHAVDQRTIPWDAGGVLPAVRALPGFPRDRSFVLPWEQDDERSNNLFLKLEQYFGPDWQARLVVDAVRNDDERLVANGPSGLLDPESGDGLSFFGPIMADIDRDQRMADFKLSGRLRWRGLEQRVAMNLYRSADEATTTTYATDQDLQFLPVNVYDFRPDDFPAPQRLDDAGSAVRRRVDRDGAGLTLDLSPWQPLRVIGSYRWTSFENRILDPDSALVTLTRDHHAAPSYLGLSYAASERWNVYASWAEVYESNASVTGPGGAALDPITGEHYETGVKFAAATDLLATLALFRVEQTGFTRFLGADDGDPLCCYDNGFDQRVISEGVEFGVIGSPVVGVQVTANYVYSRNEIRGSDAARAGERFSDETPRHLFQFWTRWRPSAGVWERLTLGGGIYAQSESSWRREFVFTPEDGPQVIASGQGGYGLVSLYAAWRFDARWEAAVNADNVLDRRYDINRGSSAGSVDLYGTPRSLQLTLRGTF